MLFKHTGTTILFAVNMVFLGFTLENVSIVTLKSNLGFNFLD
jgi:hypothetical protein